MSKFSDLQDEIEDKGFKPSEAGGIAASQGRKKYGKEVMSKASQAGVSAEAMKRRLAKKRMG